MKPPPATDISDSSSPSDSFGQAPMPSSAALRRTYGRLVAFQLSELRALPVEPERGSLESRVRRWGNPGGRAPDPLG